MPKHISNPLCPVAGCRTKIPHIEDSIVSGLIADLKPAKLAKVSYVAMAELRDSIKADMDAKRSFAWQSRIRQVEEIYIRALYCLFIATKEELPHIFSGARPNGITAMYRKVNKLIFEGRGQWEATMPGKRSGQFRPMDVLNNSGHASYIAITTAISFANNPKVVLDLDGYIKYLNGHCERLDYMHKMFKAGKDKATVLDAIIAMHKPKDRA